MPLDAAKLPSSARAQLDGVPVAVTGNNEALPDNPAQGCDCLELADRTALSVGTVQPVLARMEILGWLSSQWERLPSGDVRPRRRQYWLSPHGADLLKAVGQQQNAHDPRPDRPTRPWTTGGAVMSGWQLPLVPRWFVELGMEKLVLADRARFREELACGMYSLPKRRQFVVALSFWRGSGYLECSRCGKFFDAPYHPPAGIVA